MMAGQETFTLYLKADAEGYLEKINSSKWLSGKTRVWCELYGTVLHIFKDSKRSSTGAQQMDMKQVHTVRKSTNDMSGTQFEIISKNKHHTFSASSVDECNSWIRHLQTAMTLEDKEQESAPTSSVTVGDYETIKVLPEDKPTSPCIKLGASRASDSGYCEVEIQPAPAKSKAAATDTPVPCQPVQVEDEDGYSRVEFRKSQGSKQPVSQKNSDADQRPSSQSARPVVVEDGSGYAVVELRKKSLSEEPRSSGLTMTTEAESKGDDSYIYTKVKPKAARVANSEKLKHSGSMSADGMSEGSSDEDDLLIAAAQRKPDPIPSFPHPLQPDDLQPLADLQEFLSCNRKLCRPSFTDRTVTENPVDDMKRLLEELRS